MRITKTLSDTIVKQAVTKVFGAAEQKLKELGNETIEKWIELRMDPKAHAQFKSLPEEWFSYTTSQYFAVVNGGFTKGWVNTSKRIAFPRFLNNSEYQRLLDDDAFTPYFETYMKASVKLGADKAKFEQELKAVISVCSTVKALRVRYPNIDNLVNPNLFADAPRESLGALANVDTLTNLICSYSDELCKKAA
jgi:hypothetical protein